MRWGLFWRPLRFKLSHCGQIINAALLLHNFLVNERDTGSDDNYFKNFSMASVIEEQQLQENAAQLSGTHYNALGHVYLDY